MMKTMRTVMTEMIKGIILPPFHYNMLQLGRDATRSDCRP